ncbi:MAG: serine/threonine-protein kinase [Phycisphaerae bacterium]|jgi:serine/threonine protein kinase
MASVEELTDEQWNGVHELIAQLETLPRSDRADRLQYLRDEGAASSPILHAVERWFRLHPGPPETIAGFRLFEELGTGGMGTVYRAMEQESRHIVALKIIKGEAVSPESLDQFWRERRVIAALKHPNIAQYYVGPSSRKPTDALPYYAMEYIEHATTIVDHADAITLDLPGRLRLFLKVCDGIRYAHQKGVIHRDLKPTNILIGDAGEPKIIDFGVARVTNRELALSSCHRTRPGEFAGTYLWASPEQFEGNIDTIDVRTDVYSLGVVLYELLTGHLPFAATTLADLVREKLEDPPWPSTRCGLKAVSSSWLRRPAAGPVAVNGVDTSRPGEQRTPYDAAAAAGRRSLQPESLGRALRGDLDWIVCKCLEPDRARRFESVDKLADAIRRHLDHQPIPDRPSPTWERAGKFVRRHRALTVSAAVIALVVALGSAVAAWQAVRATREAVRARRALEETEWVQSFLLDDILASIDPQHARGADLTVREVLDEAARRVETDCRDRPRFAATLHETIGRMYYGLGLYPESEKHLRQAVGLRKSELGTGPAKYVASLRGLAEVLRETGQWEEARPLCERALTLSRELWGDESAEAADSLAALGSAWLRGGDSEQAERCHLQALEIRRALPGQHGREIMQSLVDLADVSLYAERYADAVSYCTQALDTHVRAKGGPLDRADILTYLANAHRALGDLATAERMHGEALHIRRAQLGDVHPVVAISLLNLSGLLEEQMERGESADRARLVELHEEVTTVYLRLLGPRHRMYAVATARYGASLLALGRREEAEQCFRDALDIWNESAPQEPFHVPETEAMLLDCLVSRGECDQAKVIAADLFDRVRLRLVYPPTNRRRMAFRRRIAEFCETCGNPAQAAEWSVPLSPSPAGAPSP